MLAHVNVNVHNKPSVSTDFRPFDRYKFNRWRPIYDTLSHDWCINTQLRCFGSFFTRASGNLSHIIHVGNYCIRKTTMKWITLTVCYTECLRIVLNTLHMHGTLNILLIYLLTYLVQELMHTHANHGQKNFNLYCMFFYFNHHLLG